jgi:hypothetical protein
LVRTDTWRASGTHRYSDSLWYVPVLGEPLGRTGTWKASGT